MTNQNKDYMASEGKFYILCKRSDDDPDYLAYFQPIMATVMIHRGFHLIVHKQPNSEVNPGWRVSEMLTGKNIVSGYGSKNDAKEAARKIIDQVGLEKMSSSIYHNIELFGVSPRFRKGDGEREA